MACAKEVDGSQTPRRDLALPATGAPDPDIMTNQERARTTSSSTPRSRFFSRRLVHAHETDRPVCAASPTPLVASRAGSSCPLRSFFASDRPVLEPRALASGGEGGVRVCATTACIRWKVADVSESARGVEAADLRRKGGLADAHRPWRLAVGRTSRVVVCVSWRPLRGGRAEQPPEAARRSTQGQLAARPGRWQWPRRLRRGVVRVRRRTTRRREAARGGAVQRGGAPARAAAARTLVECAWVPRTPRAPRCSGRASCARCMCARCTCPCMRSVRAVCGLARPTPSDVMRRRPGRFLRPVFACGCTACIDVFLFDRFRINTFVRTPPLTTNDNRSLITTRLAHGNKCCTVHYIRAHERRH